MDTIEAIYLRKSIRKFKDRPVDKMMIERILRAGISAPSAKNRQPWEFVVVTEKERQAMINAMREGLEWMDEHAETDQDKQFIRGAYNTMSIMRQAPVNIFILNPYGKAPAEGLEAYGERFAELANVQSVGAAIQNMCLAATELGLGSLWIADVYSAYHTLTEWLGTDAQMVAALSIGYANEEPFARPRKALEEVVRWR